MKAKLTSLVFIFLFCLVTVYCKELIKKSTLNYSDLNGTQKANYDRLSAMGNIEEMNLVQIEALNDEGYDGTVTVNLSFLQCSNLKYQVSFIEYESEENYKWFGNLDVQLFDSISSATDNICTAGSLTITSVDGMKYGALGIQDDNYLIVDLSGGIQVMIKKISRLEVCVGI
jgi:hypothetical protein